ncbi:MAG: peptide deformylase [Beijerinckiaceae bacterium]|nr:peptide deformylase [Beijerinckiaceae bacterium]
MTIRPILRYPDPRLKQLAESVIAFDDELRILALDLVDTMRAAPGIGITAPHVGIMLRVVAIELPGGGEPRLYVNPEIVAASAESARHVEGSVSMPGIAEEVERPARVSIRYRDIDGVTETEDADGLLAVCLQHEIDQLDGVFWTQRLSRLRRERALKRHAKSGG